MLIKTPIYRIILRMEMCCMIDYKGNPFFLNDQQINWVMNTFSSMTTEEKIGQLFCPISYSSDPGYLSGALLRHKIGGMLFKTSPSAEVRAAHAFANANSRIPLLFAANLEFGTTGFLEDGTFFGQQMGIGATDDTEQAYRMGYVSTKEAASVGCNFAFAPVSDIDLNWRNPIVNVRSYGNDADKVLAFCKAYKRAADDNNVAISVKHFPGDGVDEVDQHLLTSVNTTTCEEWDSTYGKIYRGMINDGAKSFMIGHIDHPAWRKRLNPDAVDGIVPASLSRELMTGLLREYLGFNGLIITDATPMVGYTSAMDRATAVPTTVMCGADMFLFNRDLEEDIGFMTAGLKNGLLTEERLNEAVLRILAFKASLGLADKAKEMLLPPESEMSCIGCEQFHVWARELADKAITLVKDTQRNLPMDPEKTPRLLLELLGNYPSEKHIAEYMYKKLSDEGFTVTLYKPETFQELDNHVKKFHEKYDAVLYLANVENASNKTTNRINWFTFWGSGNNVPWMVNEVPVYFVSLANPYHLVDVPMMKTYINCYSNNDETLDALIEKLMGRDDFVGISPVDPFCGKEYLRY